MKEVLDFIQNFFEEEKKLHELRRQKDIDSYNKQIDLLNHFKAFSTIGFGLEALEEPKSDSYYEKMSKKKPPTKRLLFKIEKFNNEKYRELFRAYISNPDPKGWKSIDECFFISDTEEGKKIIAQYRFFIEKGIKKRWHFGGGDQDLKLSDLSRSIETLKLLEPSDSEESMKEYNKN